MMDVPFIYKPIEIKMRYSPNKINIPPTIRHKNDCKISQKN